MTPIVSEVWVAFGWTLTVVLLIYQHKDFEEIQGRLQRREPLIVGSAASQRLSRRLPTDVISDPLNDGENDQFEDGSVDVQRQHKVRPVRI